MKSFGFYFKERKGKLHNLSEDKWYIAKQTIAHYSENGEQISASIEEIRSDGQPLSRISVNEDGDEYRTSYAYDENGKTTHILYTENGEEEGKVNFSYENVDGHWIGTASEIIEGEHTSFKRIYNRKNILIYESIQAEDAIFEKEYNDDGLLLKVHEKYNVLADVYSDSVCEYKYENGSLIETFLYMDGELNQHIKYDSDENIVLLEDYDNGELWKRTQYEDELPVTIEEYEDGILETKVTVDLGNSKCRGGGGATLPIIGDDVTVQYYNGADELLYTLHGEREGDAVVMTPEFYGGTFTEDNFKENLLEEVGSSDDIATDIPDNAPYIKGIFNEDNLLTEFYILDQLIASSKYDDQGNITERINYSSSTSSRTSYVYDEESHLVRQETYLDDQLTWGYEYEWMQK